MDDGLERDVAVLWNLLFEIVADMEKRLSAHMALHQLTPPQFYVLKTLTERGGSCRIGQIAEEHHLTNATMTGLIKRLEAMKPPLVARQRSPLDGRAVDVTLTETGKVRYRAVQDSLLKQVHTLLHLLPTEEREEIIDRVQLYFKMLVNLFPVDNSDNQAN